jgi:hypothetical protein
MWSCRHSICDGPVLPCLLYGFSSVCSAILHTLCRTLLFFRHQQHKCPCALIATRQCLAVSQWLLFVLQHCRRHSVPVILSPWDREVWCILLGMWPYGFGGSKRTADAGSRRPTEFWEDSSHILQLIVVARRMARYRRNRTLWGGIRFTVATGSRKSLWPTRALGAPAQTYASVAWGPRVYSYMLLCIIFSFTRSNWMAALKCLHVTFRPRLVAWRACKRSACSVVTC